MNWRQHIQKWRRHVKYSIGAALYIAFNAAVLLRARAVPLSERAAIVYPDYLGDVLMWLPYGQTLVAHLRAQGKQVFVVCDWINQTLLQQALPGCEIVGIKNAEVYLMKPILRAQWLLRLRRLRVGYSFFMSHPRGPINRGESFVWALGAPAIGFASCFPDRPEWEIRWTNRHYVKLISTTASISHHVQSHFAEFLRVAGCEEAPVLPMTLSWRPQKPSATPPLGFSYWILAPGASRAFRQWPAERFAAVAEHLARRHSDWRCVIVGTAAERPLAQAIAARLGDSALDLTGKTSVPELIDWIANARLVLGNDSAAGHIAAAMGTPAVVVVGGGQWGRCHPYDPTEAPVRRLPVAVSHPMPCYGCDWYCIHSTRTDRPFPCVEGVSVQSVIRAVDDALNVRSPSAALFPGHAPAFDAGA